MSNDVEKRWNDPREVRRAGTYVVIAVFLAALVVVGCVLAGGNQAEACKDAAFRICENPERMLIAVGPPTVLLLGGLGAFVHTYRVWRSGGVWPIWQGAGWLLFVLMLAYFTLSSGVLAG